MYCNKCGKEIKEDNKFCTYCGKAVKENTEQQSNVKQEQQIKAEINNTENRKEIKKDNDVKNESSNKSNLGKKAIIVFVMMIIVILGCICGFNKSNRTNNISENINTGTTENTDKFETTNTKNDTSITEKCDTSYTGMVFNKKWSELQKQIEKYLQESYKNLSIITISDWEQKNTTDEMITYVMELRRDTKTFLRIIVEVEESQNKVISVGVSYLQSDNSMIEYALSEQKTNLKGISNILGIETEYSNYLINILPNTGACDYYENDVFFYCANTNDFATTYITACQKDNAYLESDIWNKQDFDVETEVQNINEVVNSLEGTTPEIKKILTEVFEKYPKAQYIAFHDNYMNRCWLLDGEGKKVYFDSLEDFERALQICNVDIDNVQPANY